MAKEFSYIVKPVDKEEYGVKYVVEYIDFPGISGGGDTIEEALHIAKEGLEMYLEVLEVENKKIPEPGNLKPTGRVTLRLPKSLHLKAVKMAEEEGVSLNSFIIDALSEKVYGEFDKKFLYKKLFYESMGSFITEDFKKESIEILEEFDKKTYFRMNELGHKEGTYVFRK